MGFGFFAPRVILLACILTFSWGTHVPVRAAEPLSPLPPDQGKVNVKILKGIDLIYEEHFGKAEALFLRAIADFPERPEGYFYRAMVSWARLTYGFWGPKNVKEYLRRVNQTIEVAKKRTQSHSKDSYDYFFLGGALGFKGRFELMRERYLAAFFLASDAVKALETCLRLDPNNTDVLFGLGTFDYYTARLSGLLKFLTYLLIRKGGKDLGLRKLHMAADKGIYSATEAKSMLLHIYLFLEEDFPKALKLAKELSRRYDRNSRYTFLLGLSYIRMGMEEKYREVLERIRKKSLKANSLNRSMVWERRGIYLRAIHDMYLRRYDRAALEFEKLLGYSDPERDPAMVAWPMLKLGMVLQLEGKKDEAERYYERVLSMKNGAGAQFLAKKLLKEGLTPRDPFIGF